MKLKALTSVNGLTSFFLHLPPDSWGERHWSLYASCPMPVTSSDTYCLFCQFIKI